MCCLQRPMYCQQFFEQATQVRRRKCVGPVRFRFLGIVVDFKEDTIYTRPCRRTRQHRNELGLPAAGRSSVLVSVRRRGQLH